MFMHPRVDAHPFPDRLHGELVWRYGGDTVVRACRVPCSDRWLCVRSGDVQNLRLPALQHRIQAQALSTIHHHPHEPQEIGQVPQLQEDPFLRNQKRMIFL